MAYYRLYLLSAPGGRFLDYREIEAPDDEAALAEAGTYCTEHPVELWCGSRRVAALAANPV